MLAIGAEEKSSFPLSIKSGGKKYELLQYHDLCYRYLKQQWSLRNEVFYSLKNFCKIRVRKAAASLKFQPSFNLRTYQTSMIYLFHKNMERLHCNTASIYKGTLFLLLTQWVKVTSLKSKKFLVQTVESKTWTNKNSFKISKLSLGSFARQFNLVFFENYWRRALFLYKIFVRSIFLSLFTHQYTYYSS